MWDRLRGDMANGSCVQTVARGCLLVLTPPESVADSDNNRRPSIVYHKISIRYLETTRIHKIHYILQKWD